MSTARSRMMQELNKWVVPILKEKGFKGSFPHYRRISENQLDLLMFQFDKYGMGFRIAVSYVMVDDKDSYVYPWCAEIPLEKLTVPAVNLREVFAPDEPEYGWFCYWNVYEYCNAGKKRTYPVKPGTEILLPHREKSRWVQVVDDTTFEKLAKEAIPYLDEAERYWANPKLFCRNRWHRFCSRAKKRFMKLWS